MPVSLAIKSVKFLLTKSTNSLYNRYQYPDFPEIEMKGKKSKKLETLRKGVEDSLRKSSSFSLLVDELPFSSLTGRMVHHIYIVNRGHVNGFRYNW